jgi:hypothetical protein
MELFATIFYGNRRETEEFNNLRRLNYFHASGQQKTLNNANILRFYREVHFTVNFLADLICSGRIPHC